MADWKLELKEDILRRKYPVFPSLEERITAYEHFYFVSVSRVTTPPAEAGPGQYAPDTMYPDIRAAESPFSTLLYLYDKDGNEYTFSRRGMRHIRRSLPWQGHYHTHDYIEIFYVIKGSFRQILLGEKQTFSAGDFAITDQNLSHADVVEGTEDTAVLFLSLQSDYLDRLLASYDPRNDLQRFLFRALLRQKKEQSYLHLQPAENTLPPSPGGFFGGACQAPPISSEAPGAFSDTAFTPFQKPLSEILETLVEEDYFPREGGQEIIQGNLIRLLSLLCRQYSIRLHSSDQESREKVLLYELERYIRLHPATVNARRLEEVFHYHRNYFNLLLQKYQGISFQNYVQKIRMKYAAGLLLGTRLPVREAALAAGWHNSSHFYHLFERHFGMSPSEYRRRHAEEDGGPEGF